MKIQFGRIIFFPEEVNKLEPVTAVVASPKRSCVVPGREFLARCRYMHTSLGLLVLVFVRASIALWLCEVCSAASLSVSCGRAGGVVWVCSPFCRRPPQRQLSWVSASSRSASLASRETDLLFRDRNWPTINCPGKISKRYYCNG